MLPFFCGGFETETQSENGICSCGMCQVHPFHCIIRSPEISRVIYLAVPSLCGQYTCLQVHTQGLQLRSAVMLSFILYLTLHTSPTCHHHVTMTKLLTCHHVISLSSLYLPHLTILQLSSPSLLRPPLPRLSRLRRRRIR